MAAGRITAPPSPAVLPSSADQSSWHPALERFEPMSSRGKSRLATRCTRAKEAPTNSDDGLGRAGPLALLNPQVVERSGGIHQFPGRIQSSSPVPQRDGPDVGPVRMPLATHRPGPGSTGSPNLVETLFEQGGALPGFSLHMLPPAVAIGAKAAADPAQAAVGVEHWPSPHSVSQPTALNRSELTQIADRVAQVLRERQRFERERQGRA